MWQVLNLMETSELTPVKCVVGAIQNYVSLVMVGRMAKVC